MGTADRAAEQRLGKKSGDRGGGTGGREKLDVWSENRIIFNKLEVVAAETSKVRKE